MYRKLQKIRLIGYKVFNSNEAEEWANKNYKNIILAEKYKKVVTTYCKENEPRVNFALRYNKITNDTLNEIRVLDQFLDKYSIKENIVVFRILDKNRFVNGTFTDKAFMSTSLIKGNINPIFDEHRYRLKIYLPKGTKGFYVEFNSGRGEYEFLLQRNTTLHYIGKSFDEDDGRWEIECYVKCYKRNRLKNKVDHYTQQSGTSVE